MAKKPSGQLQLPVTYGSSITLGVTTCGIGCNISRAHIKVSQAEEYFTGRRLRVKLGTAHSGDDPDQTTMWDDLDDEIQAVADVKNYVARGASLGIRLTFNESDVAVDVLRRYLKRSGALVIVGSERMPVKDDDEDRKPAKGQKSLPMDNGAPKKRRKRGKDAAVAE